MYGAMNPNAGPPSYGWRREVNDMKTLFTLGLCAAVCAGLAAAQTKISGTGKCEKPEAQHAVEVGDKPGRYGHPDQAELRMDGAD